MTTPDAQPTTYPSDIADASNDNAAADVRLARVLMAVGVYVVAAVFGWCAVGIAVALWIFER